MNIKLDTTGYTFTNLENTKQLKALWEKTDVLAIPQKKKSRYITGFASSMRCVEAAQRLRYEVFNVELGEGLAESEKTGLDRDIYDEQMTHLVMIDGASKELIGTYRMQTIDQAVKAGGIYAAQEYDLKPLSPYFNKLVELGRACLAINHRNMATLIQLWLGIGAFMNIHQSRYLFGCCSLTSRDPDDGWRAMKTIRRKKALHPELMLSATDSYNCGKPSREHDTDLGKAAPLPKLFRAYLRLGCKVISEPALDREFGTVDFLILLDGDNVKMSILDVVENKTDE